MTKWKVSLGGAILGGYIWDDASANQEGPISLQEVGGGPAVADDFALVSAGGGGGFRPISLFGSVLGLVRGPGSSSDNNLVRWDGTTGQLIQNSGVDLDDSNNLTGILGLTTTGAVTVGTNLGVTGFALISAGILTTGAASSTLFNTVATTLAIGGAATTLTLGAGTGTCTIANATVAVTNAATVGTTLGVTGNTTLTSDLAVNGGDITSTATTFNLLNATVTTMNLAGAATTLTIGALTGTATIRNAGVTLSFMNVAGFVKTTSGGVLSGGNSVDISADTNLAVSAPIILTGDTLSFGHNTTNMKITASQLNTIQDIATSSSPQFTDLTLTGGDLICSTATTFNLVNTVATTLNLGGAATTMTVGATTGTMTLRNSTVAVTNDLTVGDDLTVTGEILGAGAHYLDLYAGFGTAIQISSAESIQIVIESDAGAAGVFSITHGSLGDMMSISASADVVFSLGNLYARSFAGQNETSTATTYTLTVDSHIFLGARTSTTQVVTLPAANARGGGSQVIYVIKTITGVTMTVTTPTGSDTINLVDPGTVTCTLSRLNVFISNGVSNWAHSEM